jgi:hypothetical protein
MNHLKRFHIVALTGVALIYASCSQGEFAGSGAQVDTKKSSNPKPRRGLPDPTPKPVTPENNPDPQGLTPDNGGMIAAPDYAKCAALPKAGYAATGQCGANEVMVIINDGIANGRSCCPVGLNVLSSVPAEMYQPRPGSCGPDEVSTGIQSMTTPFCTKINAQFLKLESAGRSTYGTMGSSSLLSQIAAGYNLGDCCACPDGSVMTGNHSAADNQCTDTCAKIVKK